MTTFSNLQSGAEGMLFETAAVLNEFNTKYPARAGVPCRPAVVVSCDQQPKRWP